MVSLEPRPGHRTEHGLWSPPPEDDWGYFPRSLVPLKIAVGVGDALLARAVVMAGRRRHGVAVVEAVAVLLIIGLGVVVTLHASV